MLKKIVAVVGARPQFIKHAPVEIELSKSFDLITIHTGQHYDKRMSQVFFDELGIKRPKYLLTLGNLTHAEQTGKMLIEIEQTLAKEKPDAVLVYGDTNSTLAGALAASKLHIPVFHIEAGLRSYNREMPEEINRILTDHISTLLFTTSSVANENLRKEGIEEGVIEVGDVMYDLLKLSLEKGLLPEVTDREYYYATLHRPYNVDEEKRLKHVLRSLNQLTKKVVFAIHPRTVHRMEAFNISRDKYPNITFISPQSYMDNLGYMRFSNGVITDSGGMQKEAFWLKKKCVTIRKETEWVETLNGGGNSLLFEDLEEIDIHLNGKFYTANSKVYGDGRASVVIRNQIEQYFES